MQTIRHHGPRSASFSGYRSTLVTPGSTSLALAVVLGALCAAAGCGDSREPFPIEVPDADADANTDGSTIPDDADTGTPTLDIDLSPELAPEETGETTGPRSDDGEPCTEDRECGGGSCLPATTWPGGYCTRTPCVGDTNCFSLDSSCVEVDGADVCLNRCGSIRDCRDGYLCQRVRDDGPRLCVPAPPEEETGVADGEPCAEDDDCRGGTCLVDPEWPGGYCTTLACETFADCARDPENNRCLIQPTGNFCVRMCQRQSECRDGYECQPIGGGAAICVPDVRGEVLPPQDVTEGLDVTCVTRGGSRTMNIPYTVSEGTSAYMVVPFSPDGRNLSPQSIALPDGTQINLQRENRFQIASSQLFGFINPLVIPARPNDAAFLQAGEHTLTLTTGAPEICLYQWEETRAGTLINLNIYLVGLVGIDADNAATNPNMQRVLELFDEIYAPTGVQIGEVRFRSVPEAAVTQYSIIRRLNDVGGLVALSSAPNTDRDGLLTLNIFFTRAFAFSDGSGTLGISMGLPGPAGLHGTSVSGVAFTGEYLGRRVSGIDGTDFTAVVLAHEVGHYLGLFHTTEQNGAAHDPLDDTPECRSGQFPNQCPDLTNLMFPLAGIDHRTITADQAFMVHVSPLTTSDPSDVDPDDDPDDPDDPVDPDDDE